MSNLFSKVIDGKQFNFQPFEFGNNAGYHVDVKDEEGTRWEFSILHADKDDPSKMKIEDIKLPSWIFDLQGTLIKVINEQG
ncbi:MAG: hypothetical protein JWP81_968 [Ferruginibacter sp.]|nr:hypothetical protein [Ferruginibacter sp.]